MAARLSALWIDNREAWEIYQQLCGRSVGVLEYRGRLLERITAGWPTDEVAALLRRLDLILELLSPEEERRGARAAAEDRR